MELTGNTLFRFCPRCGSPHFKPDSGKSFICSGCNFRYFLNMSASVVAIIRNRNDEILFTYRSHNPAKGMLDLPGGFVDPGETAEQALIREIKEELNLEISGHRYILSSPNEYPFGGFTYRTLDLVFECSVGNMEDIKTNDDVSGYRFINIQNVNANDIGLKSIRNIVAFLAGMK